MDDNFVEIHPNEENTIVKNISGNGENFSDDEECLKVEYKVKLYFNRNFLISIKSLFY
jgi:hypothetical protein